jgi:phospholipid/cholesterol/gamma-HCH transport system substrate-binding protein
MENRANFVMIGAFTVLTFLLGAIFTVWIANVRFDVTYAHYDVAFEGPVRGLQNGAEVHFNGIAVGDVVDLRLDAERPQDVIAHIRVRSTTPIKVDSIAQLEPAGLTGLNYIQILAGSEAAQPLRPSLMGQRPVIASRRGQLDRLFSGGEGVLQTTLETLAQLNKLLDDRNIEAISQSLANIERATGAQGGLVSEATLAARAVSNAGMDIAVLSRGLAQTSQTYGALGSQLQTSAADLTTRTAALVDASTLTATSLTELTGQTSDLLGEARTTLRAANQGLTSIDTAARSLGEASTEFTTAARDVAGASRSIDAFFQMGTVQTLPDMTRAAQTVTNAAVTFDQLGQQVAFDPGALIAPAPQRTVEWRR